MPTSSNLLGLCFVIFSLIRTSEHADRTQLDEVILAPVLLFFSASFASYWSIRAGKARLERVADALFIVGLSVLFLISLIVIGEVLPK